jgi:hypothetical protein
MIRTILFISQFPLIFILFAGICLGQGSSKPVEKPWWFNPSGAPLKLQLPKNKSTLFLVNSSEKEVDKYRLGCVLVKEGAVSQVLTKWAFEKAERLLPAETGRFYFEGLQNKFNSEKICAKGKLAVIAVSFKDGSKYSIKDEEDHDECVDALGEGQKPDRRDELERGEKLVRWPRA